MYLLIAIEVTGTCCYTNTALVEFSKSKNNLVFKYLFYLIYGFTAMSKPLLPNKIFYNVTCMHFFFRYLE